MARIRTVKPELFRHHDLYQAEQRYQLPLRLVFIGLFCCCDREGRFRWQPENLKLDVLPYENIDFGKILQVLCEEGFIQQYRVKQEIYGCIPSWHKHQLINIREKTSDLPAPSVENEAATEEKESTPSKNSLDVQAEIPLAQPDLATHLHAYASSTEPVIALTESVDTAHALSATPDQAHSRKNTFGKPCTVTHVHARALLANPDRPHSRENTFGKPCTVTHVHARGEREGEREKEGERKYKKESSDMSGSKLPEDRVLVDKFILPGCDPGHPPPLKERPEVFRQRLREQAKEILIFLNAKAKRDYRPVDANLYLIVDRLRSGVTVLQCQQVIVKKTREWGKDPRMSNFLRPETLFNPVKFEQYVGELVFGYEGEEVHHVATQ